MVALLGVFGARPETGSAKSTRPSTSSRRGLLGH